MSYESRKKYLKEIQPHLSPLEYSTQEIVSVRVHFCANLRNGLSLIALDIKPAHKTCKFMKRSTPKSLEDLDCFARAAALIRTLGLIVEN